ncbi:Titin [Mizuhopecten yessoensis]|uniref:Titin n=1 Tax=Mizuhopecten yessoensis TaxID=6573 RepID=A0A210R5Q0_MIZYE|nr:Titin [Mizuhopecten yessoensis]
MLLVCFPGVPTVQIQQAVYTATTGTSITLVCTVTANPTHTSVFWQRNVGSGTQSINIDGINYSGSAVNSPSLTVLNVDPADSGTYTCFATNAVGQGNSQATTLSVSGSLPVVTIAQQSYSVVTGQSVTLGCTVSASPTHSNVFWQRIDNGVANTISIDGAKYSGSTVNNPSLTITNAGSNDNTVYTCSATNAVGTGTSGQTSLSVTGSLPVVTIAQQSYSVVTGQSVTLGCTVSASPTHSNVFWQRIDNGVANTISIDGSKYSGSTVNNPSLTISNAGSNDNTVYTCSATNAVGTGTSGQTSLSVTGSLPTVTVSQTVRSIVTGTTVTLQCSVSANPTHTSVFWQFTPTNGGTTTLSIDNVNHGGSSVNSPSLTVFNANSLDQGTYVCFASNLVGTGQSPQVLLSVTGSLPVVTIAQQSYSVVTGQSVTLGCTVSASPTHSNVFWQRIDNGVASSISIDGSKYSGSTVNNPSLTITNAGSNDNTVYTCSATNAVGTGTSSQTSLSVTGSLPLVTIAQPSYSVVTGQSVTLGCTVSASPTHSNVFWQRIDNGVANTISIDGTKYSGSTVNNPSLTISNAGSNDNTVYTCSATNAVGTGTSGQTTLSVTGSIPVVTIGQVQYSIVTGQTVVLGCTVASSPAHTSVLWQRTINGITNNVVINNNKYQGGTVNSPSLTITNAAAGDLATYTCSATNIVGTGTSTTTTLTVTGSIPVVNVDQAQVSVVTGQTTTLGCTVTANPAHTAVFWVRTINGVATTLTIDGSKYQGSTVNNPDLIITNAAAGDQATYTCSATNIVGTGTSTTTTLTVTGSTPVVTIAQPSYSVVTGQTVVLVCTVTADPTHTQVSWQRTVNGGTNTIAINGVKFQGSVPNTPSLTITSAAASDQGSYTCSASNAVGTGTSTTTTLTVTGSIPVVQIAQPSYSVITGTDVTLQCTVTANPAHSTVFWQKITNGVTTNIVIDGSNYGGSTVNSPSLIVYNPNNADEGTYTCFATNIVGTGQSAQTTLAVTGNLPVVVISQNAYSVTTGQSITLVCTVTATPGHSVVYWQRIDNGVASQLSIDGTKYTGSTVNTPSLTINNAAANDQTLYTCSATNAVGTGTSGQTSLSITGNVPVVNILQNAYSVVTGMTATLECTVTADPAHTSVYWQRTQNGVPQSILIDGLNYGGSTTNSPSLIVYNANTADQGVYICFATNIVGTGQSANTVLSVTGSLPVVVIPQNTYSVTTGQSITLVCTVTATPGHTVVYWQRIDNGVASQLSIDGFKYTGSTINTPSLTINNAAANDQTLYTCSATNAVGTGTSGQTSLSVTGAPPTPSIAQTAYSVITGQSITLVCTVTSDPAHSTVYWQRFNNGQAQSITIDGNKYSGATVNSPSLVISNAAASDQGSYICFATNTVGTGQSSQTVLSVTGSLPVVVIAQPSYSVITGQSTTLVCTVSSNPAHTQVYWQRIDNGVAVNINLNNNKYSGSTISNPSLTISNAEANDATVYTCSATNAVGTGTSGQTQLSVTGSPPTVTISQNAYSVVTGASVTLGCVVSATPLHTNVYWQRIVNGQAQAVGINNSKYSGSTVNSPSLIIFNAAESDEGQYICFATNIVATGQSTQTTLTVTGTIPVVSIVQPTYSVITGQSITLGCTVASDPIHTQVFWQRLVNGVYTTIGIDGNKYVGSGINSPSLTIFNTGAGDITSYTCSATNAVGTGTSSPTSLSVTGAVPTVTILQPSYTITIGTTVTISCTVSSDPTHSTVFWQRVINGQTQAVSIDGTNFGGSSVNSPSLIVYNADQADEGTYICFATNTVGTGQSAPTALVVTGSIPVVTVQQTQYSIVTGNDVTIQCTVTADPAHNNVFWERTIGGNTNQITIDNLKYSGSQLNSPSLTILSATSADSGLYVCKASNVVGTGQNVPSVVIAQPSYSVVTGSPVTLVCTVTASPSHSSVQWFRVINGVNQAVSIGTSGKYAGSSVSVPSLTINGAQSSDQGQYLCTATNIVGTGQSSIATLSVTGNLPVVTVGQTTYTVTTGGTRVLVCTINANPAATTVAWRRLVGGASTPVVIDNNKYSGGDIGTPSLTISNAQSSDEGFYKCQATNVVGTGESSNTYLDVTGTIPVVTISQNAYNVLVGSTATIDCAVNANPSHTSVMWNRITSTGGNIVSTPITIDNINYSGGSVGSPDLNVINANTNDQGFYVCTATNVVGTGTSNQAFLSVTGAPPTVTVAQTSYSILTGVTVTLQCSAFGNPAVTSIAWTRSINNGPFTSITIDGTSYSGATVSSPSLMILNADSNDLGIYKCSASNSLGTSESAQVTLSVTGDPPTVTVGQTTYNVITGSDVTLQCSVSASPAAGVVYWEKTVNSATTRLTIDETSYSGSTTSSPSLIVYSVQTDDSGVYVCKASNAVGTGQSQQVTVSVTGAAPVVVIAQPSYSVTTGTTATLTCTVTATPQASTVIWTKTANGVTTTVTINNAKFSGGTVTSPSLVITNAGSSDVGFYVCQATNAVGTGTSSQTYLGVTGALPIVQVLQPFYTVTKGQQVTLECTVSGTPAATSVAWERTSGGVTTSVSTDSTSYLGSTVNSPSLVIAVSDSVDTGTYVCTATNSVGTGRSTTTTLSVTGDIPTVAITDPSYNVVTGTSITIPCTVTASPPASSVSWSRRANINGALTSITIDGTTYSGGSTSVPSLTIVAATSADQGYYICSATNSIGTGTSGQSYLTITGAVPTVTIPSNAYSVITGSSIQIPCSVQASPPASSVTWSKVTTASGGNTVTTSVTIDGSKYQGSSSSIPSLTINNANNNDQAYYVCAAVNSVGSANSIQTYLTVSGSIPQVTVAPQFTTVLGSSITLDCTVAASPQADSISWERIIGGVTTTLTIDGTKFVGSAVNNPSLTINQVASDDQGYYICIAINSVGIGRSSQGYLSITGNIPAVVISRPSYSFVLGETAVIDCDYSATPDATSIYWNKIVNTQTTRIVVTQTNKYSGATLTNPTLTITGTDSSDQAFYRCVVGNSVGEGQSTQAYLYITGNLPTVTVPQSSYSVSLEDTVTISCTVTAVPSATTVMWEYTNGNGVISTVDLTNSRFSGGTLASPSLQISSAKLTDQGSYKCKATNSVGQGESSDVYLYVTGTLPSVRVTVSAYTVDVGSQATLACIVEASPPATSVYWTKIVNGVTSTISTAVNKYDGSTVGTPSLIINTLAVSDEGSYRCNAVNTVGIGQSGLTSLIVAYAPRNTVVNPSAVTRRETESVSSECITDANPAASYQWIKDSTSQIVSNEKILQINNIDRGHDGTYTCTATNSQGSDTARLTVDVQYKPISTITVAEATVTLSLNAQKNLECNTVANPAVQTYRWLKDGNPVSNAESLVYQVTIADTNSYGVYTCYATNSIGQSSAIAFTVQSGDVVTTTPAPMDVGLTTGIIIAIVIAAVAFLLIVIIAVCCCVTHGVCRTDDAYESKRIIVEKPSLLREPSLIMPRQEVIALQEDGFYRNPASQYRYLPALDYTYYESEGSKRERDRRSYTASIH